MNPLWKIWKMLRKTSFVVNWLRGFAHALVFLLIGWLLAIMSLSTAFAWNQMFTLLGFLVILLWIVLSPWFSAVLMGWLFKHIK